MRKINLKGQLLNWKLGNYFRELSIVIAGVFITLAGTGFISQASQEKQIKETMRMVQLELKENLKEITAAETEYLDEISFFRLLSQKQDSLYTLNISYLKDNINAVSRTRNLEYSEDALEVLKNSALMQQITDKQFVLKLLQAYKQCREIKRNNESYYKYKAGNIDRYLSRDIDKKEQEYKNTYEVWKDRLENQDLRQIILNMPNTFDENPFITPKQIIQEMIQLIDQKY